MHLLVGIDTEGDNQWSAEARKNQRFENIYALPRLHALFVRHGVRPTYVITYPVAKDPRSAEVLRELHARGDSRGGGRTAGLVPIRPFWLFGGSRVGPRAVRLRRGVERRPALLRIAQGWARVRGSAAEALLPGLRQRRPTWLQRRARSA